MKEWYFSEQTKGLMLQAPTKCREILAFEGSNPPGQVGVYFKDNETVEGSELRNQGGASALGYTAVGKL